MNRLSLVFAAPRRLELVESELAGPVAGQLLVETIVSGVSAGSEMLVYRGEAPRGLAVDETITALSGSLEYPLKYGYAAVGRVVEVGEGVDRSWRDRLVFAFQPHQSYFVAQEGDLLPLPDGLSAEAAVFLPNMETAVSLLMDGNPVIGERVAVVGQGVVGLLVTCLLARFPLTALLTLDRFALRRRWSAELGATATFDPASVGVLDRALQELNHLEDADAADLIYELSGNPQALDTAISLTGYGGRVVIGSWYGEKRAEIDLGGRFHRAHMQLVSSQVSYLGPRWLARWTKGRRLAVAWEHVATCRPERMITHRFALESAAEAYALLDEDPGSALQVVLSYTG